MMNKDQYLARVDQNFKFDLDSKSLSSLDIIPMDGNKFHILKDNVAYTAEVLEANHKEKSFLINVNGMEHHIQLSDSYDLLVQKMGLNISSSSKMNDLKAPMPGLVLEILAKVGQQFEKGDPLLILEAMKMENIIKATGEGTVKSISVNKGDAVDKGQILLELE